MKKLPLIIGGVVGLIAFAVIAVVAIQLIRSDDPDLATEAPQIEQPGLDGSPAAATATPPGEPTPGPDTSDGVRRFVIVPEESEAKYVVRESLRGLITHAVGTTRDIEGEINLTPEGLDDSATSSFRVNLDTLQSDEGMRDNYIRNNTLQTGQYPHAEFVAESITGFPADYTENEEVQLTLTGTLTIRDVSLPVEWQVLARQAGDTLTAVADLEITFQDFGMTPPSVTIATAEDEIQIQVVLTAREQ